METEKEKEVYKTFDDILFENRNKLYGAYELRTKYKSRLSRALLITICCTSVWFIPFGKKNNLPYESVIRTLNDSVIFIDPNVLIEFQKPELSKPATGSVSQFQTLKDVFTLVDSLIAPDIDSTAIAYIETGDSVAGSSGVDTVVTELPGNLPIPAPYNEVAVDIKPEFPGGLENFYKYLKRRIQFTPEARHARLKAKMYVKFVVDEKGFIKQVTILNNVGYGLDAEVQSVLLNSPKWTPGVVRNETVKTEMVLPVSFTIQ